MVDEEFCRRRWASLVRDNGKKFYVMGADEVPAEFDINLWDASHLEEQWRQQLAIATAQYGRRLGLREGPPGADSELRRYMVDNQDRWHLYKKEVFPGATLCAVLVDEQNGRLFCANVGDSGAMLYRLCETTAQATVVVTKGGAQMAQSAPGGRASALHLPMPGGGRARTEIGPGAESKLSATCASLGAGEFVPLSKDHKPSDPEELARVWSTTEGFVEVHGVRVLPHNVQEVTEMVKRAKAAGKKALYRINRDLSLSRAIGDADLKPFGVISTPDIVVHRLKNQALQGEGDGGTGKLVLVIASDGVWDTLSHSQCSLLVQSSASKFAERTTDSSSTKANIVGSSVGATNQTVTLQGPDAEFAEEAARHIVETAQPGTNDDVTVVVAVFC